jgi:hypothetical protein
MTDTHALIFASYALAIVALVLIVALWVDRRLNAKYPRLIDTAVWCMLGAVVVAIAGRVLP